jgi:hypothetical protein
MTPEQFAELLHAVSTDSTWKIVLGAILALAGGFLAKIWDEWRTNQNRRRIVFSFARDILDSYATAFSELVEFQGQTGMVWVNVIDRMLEEYPTFSRNREHLVMIEPAQLRRDIQSTILKVHGTANFLKAAVLDEITKRNANASETEQNASKDLTHHRLQQLRDQIDRARDLQQRLSRRNPH